MFLGERVCVYIYINIYTSVGNLVDVSRSKFIAGWFEVFTAGVSPNNVDKIGWQSVEPDLASL